MRKEISNDGKWIIKFETNNEKFYLSQINEGESEHQEYGVYESYNKAQNAIDRAETEKRKKFTPLNILINDYRGLRKGKITSIADSDDNWLTVWCSFDGKRSKESLNNLLKDISENEETLKRIEKLKEEIDKEKENLVRYTEEEIRKHFR